MKGPSERLKYDLRRLWECPACKRRERATGALTFRFCQCQMKQADGKLVVMQLIGDGVQRLTPVIAVKRPPVAAVEPKIDQLEPADLQTVTTPSNPDTDQPTDIQP